MLGLRNLNERQEGQRKPAEMILRLGLTSGQVRDLASVTVSGSIYSLYNPILNIGMSSGN